MLLGQRGPFARQRPLPVIEKQFCGVGIARQRARVCTGQQRCIKVDDQTILGELGGRRHEVAPGQASEQAVRQIHARHHAGHGNRSCAEDVAVIDDRRPWEQVGRFTQAAQGVIGRVELAVTTSMTVNFLRRPAPVAVAAEARILKLGKRLAYGEVLLWSEGEDEPVAHVTGTYSIPPHGPVSLAPPHYLPAARS